MRINKPVANRPTCSIGPLEICLDCTAERSRFVQQHTSLKLTDALFWSISNTDQLHKTKMQAWASSHLSQIDRRVGLVDVRLVRSLHYKNLVPPIHKGFVMRRRDDTAVQKLIHGLEK